MHNELKNNCDDCKHFMTVMSGDVPQRGVEIVHTRNP